MNHNSELFKQYRSACTAYIIAFEKKQDVLFEFWVADRVGETASFGDDFLSLSDIIFDIESGQPAGRIFRWSSEAIENGGKYISYEAYCKFTKE